MHYPRFIGFFLYPIVLFYLGCTTPYDFEGETNEDLLIVDGMITNQKIKHQIRLSRSYAFDAHPKPEKGATVWIESSDGSRFDFEEKADFIYQAKAPFAAAEENRYQLVVTTRAGKTIQSTPMQLPPKTDLQEVFARAETTDLGQEGIGVYLNAESNNNAQLYRIEYEETYKVVAPLWTPYDAVVTFEGFATFATNVIMRETQEEVCYAFRPSNEIILRSTTNQTRDRIDEEQVLFLPIDSGKLMHRYSVLVRLLVEDPQAYNYFETLKELSVESASFFNNVQPGYLAGNLFNPENDNEKVGGFFRVSAAEEQRIFLNFSDYYPNAETPPYFYSCGLTAPTTQGGRGNRELLNAIYNESLRFFGYNNGDIPYGGPYLMTTAPCGDCTVLGSNQKPHFWIP
jgi:hypothetical protein